jgi:hypothetical protein
MISSVRTCALLAGLALALGFGCDGGSKAPATSAAAAKSDGGAPAKSDGGTKPETGKDGSGGKVKVVEGAPPGKDDRYALAVEPPAEAKAGQPSKVTVRVVPKAPWHMNLDFPTSLKIEAPTGVTLTKAELKKADATTLDENSCQFDVAFTPTAAGEQSFTGKFKFAVCQDEACSPVTEDVAFKVAVK